MQRFYDSLLFGLWVQNAWLAHSQRCASLSDPPNLTPPLPRSQAATIPCARQAPFSSIPTRERELLNGTRILNNYISYPYLVIVG